MSDKPIPQHLLDLIEFKQGEGDTFLRPCGYKSNPKPCDDCGRIVIDRIVTIKKNGYPITHIREKCKSCDKYRNPVSGEFNYTESMLRTYVDKLSRSNKNHLK